MSCKGVHTRYAVGLALLTKRQDGATPINHDHEKPQKTQLAMANDEYTHGAAADDIDAVRSPVGVSDVGVHSHGHALAVHAEGI